MTSAYESTTEKLLSLATASLSGLNTTRSAIFQTTGEKPSTPEVDFDYKALVKPSGASSLKQRKYPTEIVTPVYTTPEAKLDDLNEMFDAFIERFFPQLTRGLQNQPEMWLASVFTEMYPYGSELHAAALEAVWQRARDRQNADGLSMRRTLEANASAHGFMLPNGALLSATLQLEKKRADLVREVNIEVMLKDADLRKEFIFFAVQQAAAIKESCHRTMVEWFRTWFAVLDKENQDYEIAVRAKAAFQDAVAKYWDVEVAIEELGFQIAKAEADNKQENVKNNIAAAAAVSRDSGLGQAAQAYGTAMGQAAGALGTLTAQVESL
jgi:hypothetical protein